MKRERIDLHSPSYMFGFRLKEQRKKKGLTQETFAEEFNITLDTVQNWEQHYNVPGIDTLYELCNFFGCGLDHFFGRIEEHDYETHEICEKTSLSEAAVDFLKNNKWQVSNNCRSLSIQDICSMMLENYKIISALMNIIIITLNDEEYVSVSTAENYDYVKNSDYYTPIKPPKSGLRRMFFEEIITELNKMLDDKIIELNDNAEKVKNESDKIFDEKVMNYKEKMKKKEHTEI